MTTRTIPAEWDSRKRSAGDFLKTEMQSFRDASLDSYSHRRSTKITRVRLTFHYRLLLQRLLPMRAKVDPHQEQAHRQPEGSTGAPSSILGLRVVHSVQVGNQARPGRRPVELLPRQRAGGRHIAAQRKGQASRSAPQPPRA